MQRARIPDQWLNKEVVQIVGNSAYGGGAPVIFGIIQSCLDLGLHPVLLATDPDVVSASKERNYNVWEFPGIVREPRFLHDLVTAFNLAWALKRRKTQIIHTHTSKGGMVGRLAGWLAGCDLIIHHTHGFYHTGMPDGFKKSMMRFLEKIFGYMSDIQIFINSYEADQAIRDKIVHRKKVRLLFNGIADPTKKTKIDLSEVRRQWGVPENTLLIGSISRLENEQKAIDVGIKAVKILVDEGYDVYYVIVGKGPDEANLRSLIKDLNLEDRFILPGFYQQASQLSPAFNVFYLPSRREGQSISILEAMACQVPIVATSIPGNKDLIIDGETGLLCEPDNPTQMANSLKKILADNNLSTSLAFAARKRFEEIFTSEKFRERISTLYADELSSYQSSKTTSLN